MRPFGRIAITIWFALTKGKPAGQIFPGYNYENAPAFVIPQEEHVNLNPTNRIGTYSDTPRNLMAKTLWDLKNKTEAPNSSLWNLLNLVNQKFPGVLQR
jgi:hypothetical protein